MERAESDTDRAKIFAWRRCGRAIGLSDARRSDCPCRRVARRREIRLPVWDPNPQLDETVMVVRSVCEGTRRRLRHRAMVKGDVRIETDEGEWRDGRQTGKGIQTWPTGRYDGELSDGEPNGRGVLTLQKLRYEGEFRDGKPNGVGSLTTGSETVQGNWKDGCLQGGQRNASIGVPLSACR